LPSPSRILIIRPSSLGDVNRTVPALVSLRRAFPDARIDWLVNDTLAAAIEHHPGLTGVVPFPRAALGRQLRRGNLIGPALWARRKLRDPSYDLVIDYQGLFRSGLMTRMSHSSRRLGFADARELGWLGYNQRVRVEGGRGAHHIDRVLALTAAADATPIPDMRLYSDPKDQEGLICDPQLGGTRYVVFAPTTRGLGRAWPIDRYAALAAHLVNRRRELNIDALVVTGLASEREYCTPILAGTVIDRIGQTTISSLMALIERAALVVCNDSAAMHMAVAFNRPMVALFGASNIEHAGPYKREADVISHKRPNEHVRHRDVPRASELMRRISVDEVVAACAARLHR
jgi:lipopolysaccharide heptosyltransferase I